ncbi:MAG: hypothetical protein ACP5NV_02705 [Candidatus Woesearchaeota archaeon]
MKKFNKHSLKKRSAIEIQFNWIFVAIAGAIIFAFIIGILFNQKEGSEIQLNQDIIKQIGTNIKSKQQLSNAYSEMELPKTTLTFTCDKETLISDFKISGAQREILPVEIIFAPREFTASKFRIWTQDFSIPFIVTRFIYVFDPGMVVVIYNSTSANQAYSESLFNDLPSNITKRYAWDTVSLSKAIKGYDAYKIICFANNCPAVTDYSYVSIIINPSTSNDLYSYGTIRYHTKGNANDKESKYIGKASLFGAILSDNRDYYECQMKRALEQFEIKRGLHYNRIELLETDLLVENPSCVAVLALPKGTLRDMENSGLEDVYTIYANSKKLIQDNTDLTFKGCPLIY